MAVVLRRARPWKSLLPTGPAPALVSFHVPRAASALVSPAVLLAWRGRHGYDITAAHSFPSSHKDCDHCCERADHRESQDCWADRSRTPGQTPGQTPSQPIESCDDSVRQVPEEAGGIVRPT